jgi:hypothetical protein
MAAESKRRASRRAFFLFALLCLTPEVFFLS